MTTGVLAEVVVDMSITVLSEVMIGSVKDIGVEVFPGVNVKVCKAVETGLKFILLVQLEEDFMPFCGAILSC